jgi:signal transduction histidine kinase
MCDVKVRCDRCHIVRCVSLICDVTRARQVISNGLANAAKHGARAACSGDGGGAAAAIVLRATLTGDGSDLALEVLDEGPGLRGRVLAELSKEFSELPQRESDVAEPQGAAAKVHSAFNRVRSTGLGVPISARLARLMGGALSLEDRRGGPGERVCVRVCAVCLL